MLAECKVTEKTIIVTYEDTNFARAIRRDHIVQFTYRVGWASDKERSCPQYFYGKIEAQLVTGNVELLWDCTFDDQGECIDVTRKKFLQLNS